MESRDQLVKGAMAAARGRGVAEMGIVAAVALAAMEVQALQETLEKLELVDNRGR